MKKLAILLIGVTLVFFACKKKTIDQPEINTFPTGNDWTVGRLLDSIEKLGTYQFDTVFDKNAENAVVKGYILADEVNGNIYRTVYMRDDNGKCIAIYRKGAGDGGSDEFNVRQGDYVGYNLYGSIISTYNGLPQIQVQEHDVNKLFVIYKRMCDDKIQPISTVIDSVKTGKYLCNLVKLNDVQFETYQGLTYATADATTNRNLVTCSGESVIVRTSSYASFASEPLPEGKGTLTSIVSVYATSSATTWQLLLRNADSDVNMKNPRCGEGGETMDMPYEQSFASSFGTYTTYSVAGDQTWGIDYETAKITGYVSGTNYANEDWLLSSPVNITNVEHAKAVVNYVAQYQAPLEDDVTMQVSTDYEFGTDPTTATWTELDVRYPNTGGWQDFQNVETSLDEFIGQTVTVAIKFKSTETGSRTLEVKKITIEEGEAGGGGGGGDVQSMPYTQDFSDEFGTYITKNVLGSQTWIIDYHTAKMTGYAGGSHANEDWLISSPVVIATPDHAKAVVNYAAQYSGSSDDDVTMQVSTDYEFGTDPTTATWTELDARFPNTANFQEFLDVETSLDAFIGQTITVAIKYTSTDEASRTIEIKTISIEEGEAGGITPPPTPPATTIFSETFASSQGAFTIQDVILPSVLTYVWSYDSHGCMKANAFASNTNYESETWLISPAIDMSGYSNAVLSFDHAVNYLKTGVPSDFYTVLVSTDYDDGLPETAKWTELSVANYPAGNSWTFVNSGNIDMSSYTGNANVRIAFKYTSMDDNAGCWEVKNVLIEE